MNSFESRTGAGFDNIPGEPILTLGMDVPSAWLVAPRQSVHDLDNLKLDAILAGTSESVVDLKFELEQFAIDGHARDEKSAAPRGLQLQLTNLNNEVLADTQVMANLGYFQFKLTPGIARIGIRPGRGREVYEMMSAADDSRHQSIAGSVGQIALTSFTGLTVLPIFKHQPDMESMDVLGIDEAPQKGGLFHKMVSA